MMEKLLNNEKNVKVPKNQKFSNSEKSLNNFEKLIFAKPF